MNVMVIDGETCETRRDERGQLDTSCGQVYDLGGEVLHVESGKILDEFDLVNEDVFFGMPEAMNEAYFADKIPQYLEDMRMQRRKIVDTWDMWKTVSNMCKKHNIEAIAAHNALFDVKTLNATIRYQTKSKKRYFLPYGIPIMDTMKMADQVICKTKEYIDFCKTNNYMTKHDVPRPQKTAEVLWRFLTNNNNFQEAHTGLADVKIEAQIFLECVRRGYPLPITQAVSCD